MITLLKLARLNAPAIQTQQRDKKIECVVGEFVTQLVSCRCLHYSEAATTTGSSDFVLRPIGFYVRVRVTAIDLCMYRAAPATTLPASGGLIVPTRQLSGRNHKSLLRQAKPK